jgi:hypothetical protein
MLQIHPDKVCLIIANAKEFQAQEEVSAEDAGESSGDEDFKSILLAYPDDPTYNETIGFIDALSDDEQAELVALTWLGRDDYTAAEWDQALKDAVDRHTGSTAEYLLGMPLLPDYLESGLNQFGYSCEDFER